MSAINNDELPQPEPLYPLAGLDIGAPTGKLLERQYPVWKSWTAAEKAQYVKYHYLRVEREAWEEAMKNRKPAPRKKPTKGKKKNGTPADLGSEDEAGEAAPDGAVGEKRKRKKRNENTEYNQSDVDRVCWAIQQTFPDNKPLIEAYRPSAVLQPNGASKEEEKRVKGSKSMKRGEYQTLLDAEKYVWKRFERNLRCSLNTLTANPVYLGSSNAEHVMMLNNLLVIAQARFTMYLEECFDIGNPETCCVLGHNQDAFLLFRHKNISCSKNLTLQVAAPGRHAGVPARAWHSAVDRGVTRLLGLIEALPSNVGSETSSPVTEAETSSPVAEAETSPEVPETQPSHKRKRTATLFVEFEEPEDLDETDKGPWTIWIKRPRVDARPVAVEVQLRLDQMSVEPLGEEHLSS